MLKVSVEQRGNTVFAVAGDREHLFYEVSGVVLPLLQDFGVCRLATRCLRRLENVRERGGRRG